jgi:hypothetical protein
LLDLGPYFIELAGSVAPHGEWRGCARHQQGSDAAFNAAAPSRTRHNDE